MDVLKLYLPLCWFKNNPLQLPISESFLKQNLAFHFVLVFITLANMIPVLDAFVEVFAETVLTLLFVFVILSLNRTMHAYIPVVSAILLTENIVSIMDVPVIAWLTLTHDWLSYTALVGLIIWDYALVTYIMKKVLAVDIFASLVVTFFYFMTTYGAAYVLTLLI